MLQLADTTVTGAPRRGERMATAALQTEIGWIEVSADNDAITRLFWRGVPVINLPTRVIYPENGLSHFRMWRDNARITAMHTRLLLGMLPRAPRLLLRTFHHGNR